MTDDAVDRFAKNPNRIDQPFDQIGRHQPTPEQVFDFAIYLSEQFGVDPTLTSIWLTNTQPRNTIK